MGLTWVKDFRGGLDKRRLPETLEGGQLIRAYDCHITRAGQIEQRAVFEEVWHDALGETGGLYQSKYATAPAVVGYVETRPATLPDIFAYGWLTSFDYPPRAVMAYDTLGEQFALIADYDPEGSGFTTVRRTLVSPTVLFDVPPTNTGGATNTLLTHAQKLFIGAGTHVHFSALRDGADWVGTGSGFIDLSFESGTMGDIYALAPYGENLAVFGENAIQVWAFDPDPLQSVKVQELSGVGTYSPRGLVGVGQDVWFLSKSGVRSLRARDVSGQAQVSDIGAPIDTVIGEHYRSIHDLDRWTCRAIIEPTTGNCWFSVGDRVYVLAFFPDTKVHAWSVYKPGFVVRDMIVAMDRVWLRSDDNRVYVYGAMPGEPYRYSAADTAEVWLPYLDASEPARRKVLRGVDVAARGAWDVAMAYDPLDDEVEDRIGRVNGTTYGQDRIVVDALATHFSLRLRSRAPTGSTAPAIISSAVVHHDLHGDTD